MRGRRFFYSAIDFYLYSNLHIAFCAVAMVLVTQAFFEFTLRRELLVFVFCGTFFLYNLQRLPSAFVNVKIERKFSRHRWNTQHRYYLVAVCLVAAGLAAWSFFRLYFRSQVVAVIPAVLSFAYAFSVIPSRKGWIRLRELPAMKVFVIALVWGMICALLPAAAADVPGEKWFSLPVLLWFIAISVMIFGLTVPFDIRDLEWDAKELRALPSILGVKKAIIISLVALAVSDVLVFAMWYAYGISSLKLVMVYFVWSVLTGWFIALSTPQRHEYFYSLLLDGTMLLLWGMVKAAELAG